MILCSVTFIPLVALLRYYRILDKSRNKNKFRYVFTRDNHDSFYKEPLEKIQKHGVTTELWHASNIQCDKEIIRNTQWVIKLHKEAATRGVLWKSRSLKIWQNSQENTVLESLFNKVAGLRKETQTQVFFCEFCEILRTPILKNICKRLVLYIINASILETIF